MTSSSSEQSKSRAIDIAQTDRPLPLHWLSGSLKYTDFEPLTEGGTAVLQTCLDKNLHRRVVFKTLHPHLRDSELENNRFLREARVTAMIPHPGTVPVYEIGRDRKGVLFFTMKKLEGKDLSKILSAINAGDRQTLDEFPRPALIDVVIQACQTVAYAHATGVIHRDLKPANILVGEFAEVTVIDWGLAKVHGEKPSVEVEQAIEEAVEGKDAVSMELTQPGRRYGTPLYMSPEQACADPNIDERSDVYNLGSILFEILTGKNLVVGTTVEEAMEQILKRDVPIPHEISPDREIPSTLEAICLKALARDPEDRYQSVQTLGDDLIAHRSGEAVSVCLPSAFTRLMRWQNRHALAVTAAISAALGALGMLILVLLFG